MSTIQDLVNDVRRHTFGSMPENIGVFENDVAAGARTLVFDQYTEGILPGHIVSCGLNVWFVRNFDDTSKTAVVLPAYGGSNEDACSAGSAVYLNPTVTDFEIFGHLCDAFRQMSSPSNGLYKRDTWTDDVDSIYNTYTIPDEAAGMLSLIGVRYRNTAYPDVWQDIPNRFIEVQRSQGVIRTKIGLSAVGELEFRYKAPFTVPTSLSDDPEADCGLSSTMLGIPALQAAADLLRATEGRRNQVVAQGDPRRAEEVPSSSNLRAALALEQAFQQACSEERARLIASEPIRVNI